MRIRDSLPILLALALLSSGCGPYGDGAAFARASRKQAEQRAAEMRDATVQTLRGQALQGDVLQRFLSGRSFRYDYGSFPNGRRGAHVSYHYFAADGSYLVVDNHVHGEPELVPGDHWRVDGERLCVRHQWLSQAPRCFTAAVDGQGRLQLYIDEPGSRYHGLLTSISKAIRVGPPPALPLATTD